MWPVLFSIPAWLAAGLLGGFAGLVFAGDDVSAPEKKAPPNRVRDALYVLAGAVIAAIAVFVIGYGTQSLPVHSYGAMMLAGYSCGVIIASRRAHLVGVTPTFCLDISMAGAVLSVIGARIFYVLMNWAEYTPWTQTGEFDSERLWSMFKIWEGGLVFYGAFLTALPWTWFYCHKHKIKPLVFLDFAVPSLIAGLAFGRIGCFLKGCCYGRTCNRPWAVHFPPGSDAYDFQKQSNLLFPGAAQSLGVHPSQLYAAVAAGLTTAFLYSYWPHRKYDGQITSLMLIMAGATRFFEEALRSDESAVFPALSASLTIAQWLSIGLFTSGVALMLYFRSRRDNRISH